MKATITASMLVGLIASVGCTSNPMQHFVAYDPDKNEKYVVNIAYPSNSAFLVGDTKEAVWARCPISALDLAFDKLDSSWCVLEHDHHDGMTYIRRTHTDSKSLVKEVGPSAIMGGAFVAGMYGIRPNQTSNTTTQNGGGASSSSNNNVSSSSYQSQGQSQHQSADISIRSGGHH